MTKTSLLLAAAALFLAPGLAFATSPQNAQDADHSAQYSAQHGTVQAPANPVAVAPPGADPNHPQPGEGYQVQPVPRTNPNPPAGLPHQKGTND